MVLITFGNYLRCSLRAGLLPDRRRLHKHPKPGMESCFQRYRTIREGERVKGLDPNAAVEVMYSLSYVQMLFALGLFEASSAEKHD